MFAFFSIPTQATGYAVPTATNSLRACCTGWPVLCSRTEKSKHSPYGSLWSIKNMTIAHRISHGTNVVVVNSQSVNREIFLAVLHNNNIRSVGYPVDYEHDPLISSARSAG